jgi:antitoxin MazE
MPVQVRLAKWGNSLGLRVPRHIVSRLGLTEGARVNVEATDDGQLVITPLPNRFALDELLKRMVADREHDLEDDDPAGSEEI